MDDELTPLQDHERSAMTGDRTAVLHVVSALRQYRAAVAALLVARYSDGFVDGVATSALDDTAREIELSDSRE